MSMKEFFLALTFFQSLKQGTNSKDGSVPFHLRCEQHCPISTQNARQARIRMKAYKVNAEARCSNPMALRFGSLSALCFGSSFCLNIFVSIPICMRWKMSRRRSLVHGLYFAILKPKIVARMYSLLMWMFGGRGPITSLDPTMAAKR